MFSPFTVPHAKDAAKLSCFVLGLHEDVCSPTASALTSRNDFAFESSACALRASVQLSCAGSVHVSRTLGVYTIAVALGGVETSHSALGAGVSATAGAMSGREKGRA